MRISRNSNSIDGLTSAIEALHEIHGWLAVANSIYHTFCRLKQWGFGGFFWDAALEYSWHLDMFWQGWTIKGISSDTLSVGATDPELCSLTESDLLFHVYCSPPADIRRTEINQLWICINLYYTSNLKQSSFSHWWNQWGCPDTTEHLKSTPVSCLHLQDDKDLTVLKTIWKQCFLLWGSIF